MGESAERISASASGGGAPTQTTVFACSGEYWTVTHCGLTFSLKSVKGLKYIQDLLRHPGEEFHALDLLNRPGTMFTAGSSERSSPLPEGTDSVGGLGDAGEMLDTRAKQDYRRRLRELQEHMEDLRERGSLERADEVESEIDFLTREISHAVGRGGRDRRAGSVAERARLNVTRAIKAALQKISERNAPLGELLGRVIKTGLFCSYVADSRIPINWQFSVESPQAAGGAAAAEPLLSRRESSFLRAFTEGTTFVGREAERSTLARALEQALKGAGKIVLIGGAAGVGKTRIAAEIGAHASQRGMLTLVGSCYDRDDPVPFIPFVEILEAAMAQTSDQAAFREALGNDAPEMARLLPRLRRQFPDIPPPMELPPEQSRRILFGAVTELVARVARNIPVLFLLDDLQWADEGTLLLLSHLAQLVPKIPVLIVGTYRDSELDHAGQFVKTLDEMIRLHLVERITLGGLSRNAVAEMLRALSGREPPESVVNLFHVDTEGNPFFVEELFRHLVEQEQLMDSVGEFRHDLKLSDTDVPQSLRLVIGRRLARLSDRTLKALGTAAIMGRSFTFELLAASIEADPDSLLDCVEEAERAGLISSTVQYPEARFRFYHELIRRAVVSRLSVARRQRLHLDVANAIERVHANALEDQANDLAHHLWQAGTSADGGRTAHSLAIAARRAREQGALTEAESYYRQALNVLETTTETPARDQQELILQLALAQVLIATRGYTATETAEAYDRASVLGQRLGDPMQVVLTLTGLCGVSLVQGKMEATQALAERVWAAADRSARPSALIWGDFLQGVPRYHRGELTRAEEFLRKAIAEYHQEDHRSNPQDPGTESLQYLALIAWQLGMADTARARMREAIALADRSRKPYAFAHNRLFAAYLYALLRDPVTTQQFSEALITLTQEPSIPVLFDLGRILHGWAVAERGRFAEGVRYARDGVTSFTAAGNGIAIGSWLGFLAEVLARCGALDEALSTVEEGLVASGEQIIDLPYLLWLRGELLVQRARGGTAAKSEESAELSFRSALALAGRIGAKSYALRAAVSLGRLLKSHEKFAEARDLILPIWKHFAEGFDTRDLLEAKALFDELS